MTAEADVKTFVIDALHQLLVDAGVNAKRLPEDFDLRAHGVVDSLGFIQLIGRIEDRFACSIDLADVDPNQLTRLSVLCSHIAAQVNSKNGH
jgi:acyl carrier protein